MKADGAKRLRELSQPPDHTTGPTSMAGRSLSKDGLDPINLLVKLTVYFPRSERAGALHTSAEGVRFEPVYRYGHRNIQWGWGIKSDH
jgi:hypothetical protein